MVKARVITRPRRGAERGATLFVVVLAITLLTGIGLFTVHSSSLLARAAGNEREAMQTTYLAELATLTSLSVIAAPLKAQLYTDQALSNSDPTGAPMVCPANMGIAATANPTGYRVACAKFSNDSVVIPSGATFTGVGSFGPADPVTGLFPIGGVFETQLTDVIDGDRVAGMVASTPPPGSHWAYREVKLTTAATLQPANVTAACVNNVMQVAGQHVTRAHALVGPVQVKD